MPIVLVEDSNGVITEESSPDAVNYNIAALSPSIQGVDQEWSEKEFNRAVFAIGMRVEEEGKVVREKSIIQLDMNGDEVSSVDAFDFANTKEQAKEILGSVDRVGNDLLIADSINKRAVIYDVATSEITWEYKSDRFVTDFRIEDRGEVVLSVGDDAVDESTSFVRQNTLVIWENDSSSAITIYSGTTTADTFDGAETLDEFGQVFQSPVLQPGERFSYKFTSIAEQNWFVYPGILTGLVTVTKNRVSSRDTFLITESDSLDSPFSSRVIKVDTWGNILWTFGEGYVVKPRDARPLVNGNVLIST
jgi:hypothetical protein